MGAPNFRKLLQVEEGMLKARLDAVRAAIEHNGEKGRGLEQHAVALLRDMLPNEYGVTTGFIAHAVTEVGLPARVELSPQCDVIIFDAVRGAPIVNLGSSQVVGIESVYAAVEVKASFSSKARDIANWSAKIRQLTLRHYVFHEERDADPVREGDRLRARAMADVGVEDPARMRVIMPREQRRAWEPPLTFALAFEYGDGREPGVDEARDRLKECLGADGQLDGLLIPGCCALWSDTDGSVGGTREDALAKWRNLVVGGLSAFPRPGSTMTPDLRPYFDEYVLEEPAPTWIVSRW